MKLEHNLNHCLGLAEMVAILNSFLSEVYLSNGNRQWGRVIVFDGVMKLNKVSDDSLLLIGRELRRI